jgi:tryptophan synthase beta chain
VRLSHDQKPYRKTLMELFGANVIASPSDQTAAGRAILKDEPDSPGSLGIAISEAVEAAVQSGGHTKYALGSVLNHVLQQQTVIGQEAIMQMELADDYPDVVIGCTGGGSNFAGLAFPFVSEVLAGVRATEFVAVEPEVCASLSEGLYTYDYGDTAATTPLLKMHTLGHDFRPPSHHAGGLRYHGMAPQVSQLVDAGLVQVRAESQSRCFDAAAQFARAEAIVPAPESSHAIRVAIDEALAARATGHDKVILFNLSGHGHFDMGAYRAYLAGSLEDPEAVVAG